VDEAIDAFIDERFGPPSNDLHVEINTIMRHSAQAIAALLAQDPTALDSVEWRALEWAFAEAFNGLGFTTRLTPPSNDGGKDLILGCEVSAGVRTYVVEIKHWVCGKKVGPDVVEKLLRVVVRGGREGGLILATSGFSPTATEALISLESRGLYGASREGVFTLCRLYASGGGGLLTPQDIWAELTNQASRDA